MAVDLSLLYAFYTYKVKKLFLCKYFNFSRTFQTLWRRIPHNLIKQSLTFDFGLFMTMKTLSGIGRPQSTNMQSSWSQVNLIVYICKIILGDIHVKQLTDFGTDKFGGGVFARSLSFSLTLDTWNLDLSGSVILANGGGVADLDPPLDPDGVLASSGITIFCSLLRCTNMILSNSNRWMDPSNM